MSTVETSLKPIDVPPGIVSDITPYSTKGAYVSCNNIRFRKGKPQKIGGRVLEIVSQYSNSSVTSFTGVPRDSHTWIDLKGQKYLAVGTNKKLELFLGGKIYDITPIESTVSSSNIVQTVSGSSQVTLSVQGHTKAVGSYVEILNQASSVGNILLDGTYEIVSVVDTDHFNISVTSLANTTSTGGGSIELNFLLEPGLADNGSSFGWGAGTWGTPGVSVSAGWSEPRGEGAFQPLRQWSLDNWGQDLLANPRGGRIYQWEASAGPLKRAQLVTASPSINDFILVAQPARHVMSFGVTDLTGTYDPLGVRWSDSEDYNNWTPSVSSEAGDFRLKGGNVVVGAEQTSREIVAVTDNAAHRIRYLGNDFVFGSDEVGADCGLVSPHGIVDVNGIVYWMSFNGFFSYNGSKTTKLASTIDKSIFDSDEDTSINFDQKEKTFCGHNTEFNEVIWFYPSKNSIENNRYVIFNYLEGVWYDGWVQRTTWEDADIFAKPYATDASGRLWIHENGKNDGSDPLPSFIETGEVDVESGDVIMFFDKFIPDFELPTNGAIDVTLFTKKYPGDTWRTKTYQVNRSTRYFKPRQRGRLFKVRYSVDGLNSDYEVGVSRISMKPDGKR